MAVIREILISNFRGVKFLKWWPNPGINCLIGPGDGGKSTILDAIELTLGIRQNALFTDADFHGCQVADPIVIDVTLGALPEELISLEAYVSRPVSW
jgi:predicted ATP-dependent endonuclease of OLD family